MTASHIIDRILGLSGLPAEQHASVRSEINDIVKRDTPPNQHQVNMDNIAAEIVEHQQTVEDSLANLAMAKAKLEDAKRDLRSLPPVPGVKVTTTKRPALAPLVQQSRCVKAKSEQDNRISISAGSLSFDAVTTKKGELTHLSLQKTTIRTSPEELHRKIKISGKEQTSCYKICPLDDKENTTACNKFFKYFDAKEAIPVLKYTNGRSVYLVSPKLRPRCSYLKKVQGDTTIYAIIT